MVGYIALGSNLGDRVAWLRFGVEEMRSVGIPALSLSSVWETEAVDCAEPFDFLNMAARIDASHPPFELLERLQCIERAAGRAAHGVHAPRTLDLDLLLLGDLTIDDPRLTLPHPRMWERAFVLEPLFEVGPDLRNPSTGKSIGEARSRLPGRGAVRRIGPLAHARSVPV